MSHLVAAFGEVLWDLLPDGPELGGAPLNFAARMAELGYEAVIISAVGRDELGRHAVQAVERIGLSTDYLQQTPRFPTGTVEVSFDESKQPSYEIVRNVAYDHVAFEDGLKALAATADCLLFGTLAQRSEPSRKTLRAFLTCAEASGHPLRFLDVNLRKGCYSRETIERSLHRADLLKLNDEEALQLAHLLEYDETSLQELAERLLTDWSLQHCVVTMGARGALCVSRGGACIYDPGYDVELVDPCGSGDAFSAGFLHQLLRGQTAAAGCRLGNVLGAIVATQHGATQPIRRERIDRLLNTPPARIRDPRLVSLLHEPNGDLSWTT